MGIIFAPFSGAIEKSCHLTVVAQQRYYLIFHLHLDTTGVEAVYLASHQPPNPLINHGNSLYLSHHFIDCYCYFCLL